MRELEAIKERAEAATEGPWSGVGAANIIPASGPPIGRITRAANQAFVAHARTDIPKLVAALEAVEAKLQWLDFIQAEHAPGRHNLNAGGTASVLRQAITEALA